jgi:hypothetical protein
MNDQIWQNDRTITFDFIIFWFFCVPETRFWKKNTTCVDMIPTVYICVPVPGTQKVGGGKTGWRSHQSDTSYTVQSIHCWQFSENDSPAKFFFFFSKLPKKKFWEKIQIERYGPNHFFVISYATSWILCLKPCTLNVSSFFYTLYHNPYNHECKHSNPKPWTLNPKP